MELVFKDRAKKLLPRDAPHRFHRVRWEIRVELLINIVVRLQVESKHLVPAISTVQ
jgi:hypothetical protein